LPHIGLLRGCVLETVIAVAACGERAVVWVVTASPIGRRPRTVPLRGWANAGLIGVVILSVLFQAYVPLTRVTLLGLEIGIERLICAAVCIGVMVMSMRITAPAIRRANDFNWHPMAEVAILFAGIFITIDPVLSMLGEVARAPALHADEFGVLRLTGDNAPTYLTNWRDADHPGVGTGRRGGVLRGPPDSLRRGASRRADAGLLQLWCRPRCCCCPSPGTCCSASPGYPWW
jgi:hypothetical protein